ncbi:Histidine kinase [Paraburkholderia unamae]|uniref:ATP-binding response regulator n=1 Tax=Paraburkholderia unamae TaxID=219649 RepID=UPI001CAC4AE1|nr:hybrid sensor histidine kinase/response regulator [Paraburkholderia unamae]CAG9252860.1 Histidine kinase [Paraburkholderia unamae]
MMEDAQRPGDAPVPAGSRYRAAAETGGVPTERVRAIQVAALRRSFPFALAGSVVSACVSAYVMSGAVALPEVGVWIGATLAVAAWRLAAMLWFDHTREQPGAAARWLRRTIVGNLLSGALWGFPFAWWSFVVPLEFQLFFVVILLGLGTGAIYSNYMKLEAAYAFEVPAFAPVFIAFALKPSAIHLAMLAAGGSYLVATLAFIHRMHRTHVDALRLGYENLSLLEQVRLEKEAAERSDREKSRFLAAASHDLRQPVHAVSLFLGLLADEPLTERGRYLVDNIARATTSMGQLFDALLNLSRLEAGVVQPRAQPFALARVLDQLRAEYEPQAQHKGLDLRIRPSGAWLHSDPVLLERTLRNLVSNAIVHTERGRVLVGCRMRGEQVRIEVWDTGPGIPLAEQERVFWEFHQLRNPERDRSKGLGLGLSIVRRTVTLLGHTLRLQSIEGKGTVFALSVARGDPNAVRAGAAQDAPPRELPPRAVLDATQGSLIVVVDDDAQNETGMRLLLENWGYRVVSGASRAVLLERVVGLPEKPALIVSDYRLRDHETGVHLIEALRDEYNDPDLPALLVSGDTDPNRLVDAAAHGIPLLHKPIEVDVLREWVRKLLTRETQ